jgi:multidrug resistance efflux pump
MLLSPAENRPNGFNPCRGVEAQPAHRARGNQTQAGAQRRWRSLLLSLGLFGFAACAPQEDHAGHDHTSPDHADHDRPGQATAKGSTAEAAEHVELTPEQIKAAGIQRSPAGPAQLSNRLTLTASVAADPQRRAHVSAPFAGRLVRVDVGLHAPVEAGAALCTLRSPALAERAADLTLARERLFATESALAREQRLLKERLELCDALHAQSAQRHEAWCRLEADLAEQALATRRPLIEAERARDLAELEAAFHDDELRAEHLMRTLSLEREAHERRLDCRQAERALAALLPEGWPEFSSSLANQNIDGSLVADGDNPAESLELSSAWLNGELVLRAPIAGRLARQTAFPGEQVEAGAELFEVLDLSRVWVLAAAFERDLSQLRVGQVGRLSLGAFPDLRLESQLTHIGLELDPQSRSLPLRFEVVNPSTGPWPEPLRPGLFAEVELALEQSTVAVAVPVSALMESGADSRVFVETSPGFFALRRVQVGRRNQELVEVQSGVTAGEAVVTAGTFALRSALKAELLGGGHSH